ncbi:sulfite reductase subunit beta (hemoprotein) [Dehalobacterium formicoaceticum]|uniref:sulfite reductase subunit beta (hemoprotein) n=1 Tax=Dehalobacterium formicoaceticum TaxID=51515 RepID=UPI000B7FBE92|nr:sulfite reductase subunit beta (hemoprotein) [Dehalobacterium formicoaceticum]
MELSNDQIKALKGKGYILNKDDVHFSCRIVTPSGRLKAGEAKKITEISEKYGQGDIYLTQRMQIEIPGLKYEDLDQVTKELADAGLAVGGTGNRVRPITSCKGTLCRFGLFDTFELTAKLNERFYQGHYHEILPAKLRISITGCPHNCSVTHMACIGLMGKKTDQVAIIMGGMDGNEQSTGQELRGLYTVDQAMEIMEKIISYYREHSLPGERLGKMVSRIGFAAVEEAVIG